MLAGVRVAAFLVIAPPFANRGIPGTVKAMLAGWLAILVLPRATAAGGPKVGTAIASGTGAFVGELVLQVVVGAGLGFLVALVFSAVQSAGNMIDLFGGFQMAQAFDPMSMSNGSQFTRLYQMTAVVLLFTSGGYQLVVGGLLRTFEVLPLGVGRVGVCGGRGDVRQLLAGRGRAVGQHGGQHECAGADAQPRGQVLGVLERALAAQLLEALGGGLLGLVLAAAHPGTPSIASRASPVRESTTCGSAT